jgi:aminoacrylate hydrolase
MPKIMLDDCEIYYEEHGQGFPLMLVSGLGGIGSYWEPQIASFARDYRVIVHDHRGTGRSTKSRMRYSVEQMAADTLALMDALGIEKAHMVGHSTGGAIGQILSVAEPERVSRVILYSTWTKADAFFRRCFEIRRELLHRSGPSAYVRGSTIFLHPSWWIRDNGEEDGDSANNQVYGDDLVVEIVDSRIQAVLDFDWTARLSQIRAPVLVLGVRNDHLTPAYFSEQLARLVPGAELHIMADGGHAASQTMPEDFNSIVLSYLGRSSPKSAHP